MANYKCEERRHESARQKHPNRFLVEYTPSQRARCSSVVRAFAHGAMGRWIDPSLGGPIELFLVPATAP